jgi:hypothetical protein
VKITPAGVALIVTSHSPSLRRRWASERVARNALKLIGIGLQQVHIRSAGTPSVPVLLIILIFLYSFFFYVPRYIYVYIHNK